MALIRNFSPAVSMKSTVTSPTTTPTQSGTDPWRQSIESSLSTLAGQLDSLLESYGISREPESTSSASTPAAPSSTAEPVTATPPAASPVPATTSTPPIASTTIAAPLQVVAEAPSPLASPTPEPVVPTASSPCHLLPSPGMVPATEPSATTGLSLSSTDELMQAKLMIVDDEEVNILTVRHHLHKEGYQNFVFTTDPRDALGILRQEKPDVLLLDIKMPHVSGLDILRARSLDKTLHHLPVIILTATADPATKRQALEMGAYDFLTKPVDPNELMPRVRNALLVKRHFDQVASEAARLDELVQRRTAELEQSRQQLILSLARAAEHRDNDTGNHVIRVGCYAGIIARELGWTESQAELLEQAAQLHDVGKIGVPDAILFKPGRLDANEIEIIKKHCAAGKSIIDPYSEREAQILRGHARIGGNILHVRGSPLLMLASRIAQTHHECWDGSGYPLGLAGDDIPVEGRITSVADVFDALSSKRPYKEAFPREKCFRILEEGRGTKFDPRVLDAFFRRSAEIVDVQLRLMDAAPR